MNRPIFRYTLILILSAISICILLINIASRLIVGEVTRNTPWAFVVLRIGEMRRLSSGSLAMHYDLWRNRVSGQSILFVTANQGVLYASYVSEQTCTRAQCDSMMSVLDVQYGVAYQPVAFLTIGTLYIRIGEWTEALAATCAVSLWMVLSWCWRRGVSVTLPMNVCRGCGYDLRGSVSGLCPECGVRQDDRQGGVGERVAR